MQCGPEVFPQLLQTLVQVRLHISNLPFATRAAAVASLLIGRGAAQWDIAGLVALEDRGDCIDNRRGTICETCVQVAGKMHDVWEVNYALWGFMLGEIGFNYDETITYATLYKTYKFFFEGEPNPCRPRMQLTEGVTDWISFGYRFSRSRRAPNLRAMVPGANARFAECGFCKENTLPSDYFDFRLLEALGQDLDGIFFL